MYRIDLQTHTNRSPKCGWMSPERLVRRASATGLDGIAITDHNTMGGIEPARTAAEDDFLVIPGEEIDTTEGQLIGLFLSEPVDPGKTPRATIRSIHEQDGLVVAPHPFDGFRAGLETLDRFTDEIDAVEVLNGRCVRRVYNDRARAFGEEHNLPGTGGSDAHFPVEVGGAYTKFDIDREDDATPYPDQIATALRQGRTAAAGGTVVPLVHAGTKALKLYRRCRGR